jgi:glutathione peroxidase
MFEKIDVKGPNVHPLYRYLTSERRGLFGTKAIKWNFTKFLVDRDGRIVKRYGSRTPPDAIVQDIEPLL